MKRRYAPRTATLVALAALCPALAGCPGPGVIPASDYTDSIEIPMPSLAGLLDGTYKGSARVAVPQGSFAAFPFAEVEARVAGGRIAELRLLGPSALSQDPDFAAMRARIVAASDIDVDGVSGATFTSAALRLAVAEAAAR
jgi:uncharacterized protein with FMN-binding domain